MSGDKNKPKEEPAKEETQQLNPWADQEIRTTEKLEQKENLDKKENN